MNFTKTSQCNYEDFIRVAVESCGCNLYAVLPEGSNHYTVLVDKSEIVTLEDCINISSQINYLSSLDESCSDKVFDVASAGLDRPICCLDHLLLVKGRKIEIFLKFPVNGKKNVIGVLEDCLDDNLVLRLDDALVLAVEYGSIKRAKCYFNNSFS